MNYRSAKFIAAVVVGLVIIIAIFVIVMRHAQAPHSPSVVTIEGTIEADEVNVSSKIPGRIKALIYDEGDDVRAGQVIARLESGEIDAKVSQASGQLGAAKNKAAEALVAANLQYLVCQDQLHQAGAADDAARAKLREALAGTRRQEKQQAQANVDAAQARMDEAVKGARPQEIEQVQKAVDQASAVYRAAKATYDRFQNLYNEGVIPRQKQDEIEMQYLSAKAAYEGAQAKLSLVKEGTRSEDLRQARAGLDAAKAQLSLAREGARSEDIDQARAGAQAAGAAVALAKHNMMQAEIRRLEASAAASGVKAAQGSVDEAHSYKQETTIVAPVSGYISQKIANAGEMISAGYPIATIVKSADFRVKVYADESRFGSLKLHAPIHIELPALPGTVCTGELARIAQAADFATKKATNEQGSLDVRSVELVIRIPNPPPSLRNGMTARVQIEAGR
ncbi:MAG: efflux RND transporter periplasmic adaptor subunit [Capsulimonadaceae bacterium]|nr:efflux RND transporter periplasmic adaptor subunit [Capsulimonadaceae bacterium]